MDDTYFASFMKKRATIIGHLSVKEQDALEEQLCESLDDNGQHWTDDTYLEALAALTKLA